MVRVLPFALHRYVEHHPSIDYKYSMRWWRCWELGIGYTEWWLGRKEGSGICWSDALKKQTDRQIFLIRWEWIPEALSLVFFTLLLLLFFAWRREGCVFALVGIRMLLFSVDT